MNDIVDFNPSIQKKLLLEKLLEGEHVLLHIATKVEGVDIPEFYRHQHTVTLKISQMFRHPVSVTEESVVADLLFDRSYYLCTLPLKSIWGVTDDTGKLQVWPDLVPPEVAALLTGAPATDKISPKTPKKKQPPTSGRPTLKRVK